MNKIEYLNALKEALKNIDITVMEEIISDYEEHFQVGLEKGKSEEQICEELGSISDLVKEINEVYNTGDRSRNAHADENHDSYDSDEFSNTINRAFDSANNVINQALNAASEAISKIDVKDFGNRLKNSMEHVASQFNNFAGNHYKKEPDSFDFSTMNAEHYQDNITKSYENYDSGDCKINLVVDGLCADIYVKESSNGKINISYENSGNERQKKKYAFCSFMERNTVYASVQNVDNTAFLFDFKAYAINIYLEIPVNIGAVDIKTASGDIRVLNVKPESILTETASGDISLGQVDTGDIKIKSSSGDISIMDSDGVQIKAETFSGDIKAKNLTAKIITLKSTSGDLDADNTKADTINYSTLSGSIDIVHLKSNENKIMSTSGDVEISDSTMYIADVSSVSGDVHVFNVAGESLSVKSTSGDVELDVNVRKCRASSKSGDVEASINGDAILESSSTSGDISISLKNFGNGYNIKSRTASGYLFINYSDHHQRNLKTGTYTYGNQGSELILSSTSGYIQVSD